MTVRNRVIYPSRSPFADGQQLQRVTAMGSTSTFTQEDLYELGQLDLIDVVDDTPSVAVTIETNSFNDIGNVATLFKSNTTGCLTRGRMNYTYGAGSTAELTGVCIQDLLQNEAGIHVFSPIQDETKVGIITDNTVNYTQFLRDCFVNSYELGLAIGDNASENFNLETDAKQWLLGSGRYVSALEFKETGGTGRQLAWATTNYTTGGAYTEIAALPNMPVNSISDNLSGYQFMRINSGQAAVVGVGNTLEVNNGKAGFLILDDKGFPSVEVWDNSAGKFGRIPVVVSQTAVDPADVTTCYFIGSGISGHLSEKVTAQTTAAGQTGCLFAFQVDGSGVFLGAPQSSTIQGLSFGTDGGLNYSTNDFIRVITCGNAFSQVKTSAMLRAPEYFAESAVTGKGALRQGQIEVYLVEDGASISGVDPTLRIQNVTFTTDLTRTALNQLGNLKPYYRPLNTPIPITVAVTSIADDLTNLAKICGFIDTDDTIADIGATTVDINLNDIMANKDMSFVAMLYYQTDEDAGGVHAQRKWKAATTVKYMDGSIKTYTADTREMPQKVVVVHDIYATDESENLTIGDNQSQNFTFSARNKMFIVDTHALGTAEFERFEDNITTLVLA